MFEHPYRILIVGGSGFVKTNALLNLIIHEPDIDKTYFCAKDPYEAKYHFSINKRECTGLKYLNDSKAFIEYENNIDDIYKKILKNTIQIKNEKKIIIFDNMFADMHNNEELNKIVNE